MKTNAQLSLFRRQLPHADKLRPDQLFDQLGKLDSASTRERFTLEASVIRESEVLRLALACGRLSGGGLPLHTGGNVRTKSVSATQNADYPHKTIAASAHSAHSARMSKDNSTTKGYAGSKKRTNLSLDGELVEIAQKHFPATRHGSLSGFVENAIRREFRAMAPKLRKAGFKLPETLFVK